MTVSCTAPSPDFYAATPRPGFQSGSGADVFARLVNTVCSPAFEGMKLSGDAGMRTQDEDYNYDDVQIDEDDEDEDGDAGEHA